MSVRVGSARINENGRISGGAAGDQTGSEVSTQNWYLHSKGWILLRARDSAIREKMAHNMESICRNDNIGYCQDHRSTLTSAAKPYGYDASKVSKKVEVDCSEAVRNCVLYAGITVGSFNTANEVNILMTTGAFEKLTADKYCKSSDYLLRGDVLVTKNKGHTVVVLDNGAKSNEDSTAKTVQSGNPYPEPTKNVTSAAQARQTKTQSYISSGNGVKWVQWELEQAGADLKKIVEDAGGIDGICGLGTVNAIIAYQKAKGLDPDGVCGKNTRAKMKSD
ncbi:MAG: peptidoglycan-binding protein [Lachnospiraceae bacterium]|nr:peptidoglycan-binding protein [Lachnospiraceae bacterium]